MLAFVAMFGTRARRVGRCARCCLGLALVLGVGGCGEVDVEQLRICERLIPALVASGVAIEVVGGEVDPDTPNGVVVHFLEVPATGDEGPPADPPPARGEGAAPAPDPTGGARWIACRFAGSGLAPGRLRLTGVTVDRSGPLSEVQLHLLRAFWLRRYEDRPPAGSAGSGPAGLARQLAYATQLGIDALTLGCLYGLLAIGYTLVYGVLGRINLAFGEIAMVGAHAGFVGLIALTLIGAGVLPLMVLGLLVMVGGLGAVQGAVVERLVFRPLRQVPSQAPLIATAGLAIALQEALRLLQGGQDRWLPPILGEAHRLAGTGGFAVTIASGQLLVVGLALALFAGLWRVLRRSAFGRAVRAVADDAGMAALCGVDVGRTVALTFAVGGAYATIAGLVVLLRYGGVAVGDGFLLGFKALVAAIAGGIGSVPGAMVGGLLIAGVETFWAGYLTMAYREVAVFGLLAGFLIWRPHGLLGEPVRLANDAFRARST